MKTSDIPTLPILEYLSRSTSWTCFWNRHFEHKDPTVRDIAYAMPREANYKLMMSKLKNLVKRGYIDGCTCGCRGDFEITEKGLDLLYKEKYENRIIDKKIEDR